MIRLSTSLALTVHNACARTVLQQGRRASFSCRPADGNSGGLNKLFGIHASRVSELGGKNNEEDSGRSIRAAGHWCVCIRADEISTHLNWISITTLGEKMKIRSVLLAILLCLAMCTLAYTQAGSAQLGGIVSDSSGALIPGVTITVTNNDTGVTTTTITNDSGSYNFPSLQPGKAYKIAASLVGFQPKTVTGLELSVASNNRQDIKLALASSTTVVDVTTTANSAITTAGASIGDVLTADRVLNLPLVGNDVLSLLDTLPGLRLSALGPQANTIGGLGLDSINATRDGLSLNDGRYSPSTYGYGVFSPTTINPDMVGEIKLILSPVDAELGRGNAQIQISTRSGTNKYTGSAVWNIQNTAMNSNTWSNNRNTVNGVWSPLKPDWRNTNQITASFGGPIIKNKTFFFALWDQTINNTRETQTVGVMTDAARQGVFRYFSGWNPTAHLATPTATPTTSTNPNYPSVNDVGMPQRPLVNPDGSPYTGGLICFSVFGPNLLDGTPISPGTAAANDPYCSDNISGGTWVVNGSSPWDAKRPGFDASGYIRRIMDLMPRTNFFSGGNALGSGDGLNQAQFRWLRTRQGSNSVNAIVGSDAYSNRKQINLKLDHNFNPAHKVSGSWSYQMDDSADNVAQWPGGLTGTVRRRPVVLTINATSTLSSSLLNEARFGMNHNSTDTLPAWLNPDTATREAAEKFLLTGGTNALNGKTYAVVLNPSVGGYGYAGSNGYMAPNPSQIGNVTPLYNWADTLSWTKDRHAFKFGIDLRFPRSNGYNIQPDPTVTMGNNASATNTVSPFSTLANFSSQLPTFRQNSRNNATNMLYFLNGSVSTATQQYWIDNADNVTNGLWNDTTSTEDGNRRREQVRTEWAAFVKDDYKLSKTLTLNLGLRYEYYGSPYLRSGLTSAAVGLGEGLFGAGRGAGGQLFNNYLEPGNLYLTGYGSTSAAPLSCQTGVIQSTLLPVSNCDPVQQTQVEFVGPNTPNPGKVAIPNDWNNFGPAVGFAWQVPWFGEGKTSLRGGYQVTFGQAGRDGITIDTLLGSAPGNALTANTSVTDPAFASILSTRALNITDIPALVPVRPVRQPGATVPIYARSLNYTAYDPHYATPYTQNLTLSVARTVSKQISVEVRYVGTLARKQAGSLNLNDSTVFYNKELFDALVVTRAGGDSPLFDQMLAGLNLNSNVTASATAPLYGTVGTSVVQPAGTLLAGQTIFQTGSAHLRRSTAVAPGINQPTLASALANGNFEYVANLLLTLAPTGLRPLPTDPSSSTGAALTGVQQRTLRNGCDRIADGLYNPANPASPTNIPTRCFPENYLTSNPQFGTATYNANLGHSNYHAMQVQMTARPIQGVSIQTTYSWAKSMQLPGSGYTDPRNRDLDYARGREGPHSVRMNGTVELPIGPNKLVMGSSSGLVARLVERWQTSFIFSAATGSPADIIGAGNMRYGNGRMLVASDQWQIPRGSVEWGRANNTAGSFYGDPSPYVSLLDPQCTSPLVAATDSMGTNLQANCSLDALGLIVPTGTAGSFTLPDSRSAVVGLINPEPGGLGSLGARSLTYYGQWSLDANLSKNFRLSESKSLQIRIDTTNVMNHPIPNIPSFTIDTLGQINGKGNQTRTFQGQARLSF